MEHFGVVKARRPNSIPMQRIIPFAIFSTRRQEEIVTIKWKDYEKTRVLVRDMKHPGDKLGNNTWCDLPPEASAFIEAMPRREDKIFPTLPTRSALRSPAPVNCSASTRPKWTNSERLHFHDLRHEGISRLFEMGRTIPQVGTVSGHRSWQSLKRYSQLRQVGDKHADWKWRTP